MRIASRFLLGGLEVRVEWVPAWLPVAEQELDEADKDDAIERGELLDQHRCGLAPWYETERKAVGCQRGAFRTQLSAFLLPQIDRGLDELTLGADIGLPGS